MEKFINNNDELIKWLNLLIKERISEDINLTIDNYKKNWIISSEKYKGHVEILICNNFYKLGYQDDFSFRNISLENPFFEAKYKKLPAPGFKYESLTKD